MGDQPELIVPLKVNPLDLALIEFTRWHTRLIADVFGGGCPATKSDAATGMKGRMSPSDPFFAPVAASGAERSPQDIEQFLKHARAE